MPPLETIITSALLRRERLWRGGVTTAFRAFSGASEGIVGISVDVLGEGAVLNWYEGQVSPTLRPGELAAAFLAACRERAGLGVRGVYLKPFPKDRSRLGGQVPPEVLDPRPSAGEAVGESISVREYGWTLEVRLWEGWSTGLFVDQRENRRWVWEQARRRPGLRVLNTFSYTCGFSVAAAVGGAESTSVDVSGKYLGWGRRNFVLNGVDPERHRFARMDTFEFFQYARRKGLSYDLIVLDPPSFGSGNRKRGIRPWSAVEGYARLVEEAAGLLVRGGVILASTNNTQLCQPGRLRQEVVAGLGRKPRWVELPEVGVDVAMERGRFACVAFTPA